MQKLKFVDPEDGKTVIARWSNLIEISEEHSIVKTTTNCIQQTLKTKSFISNDHF